MSSAIEELNRVQDDYALARIKLMRWQHLMQDIVECATRYPERLTSFNSPVLHRVVLELFIHANPAEETDEVTLSLIKFREKTKEILNP